MKMFEYKTIDLNNNIYDSDEIDSILNDLGKEGWELVNVVTFIVTYEEGFPNARYFSYTFKRELDK